MENNIPTVDGNNNKLHKFTKVAGTLLIYSYEI